MATAKLYLKNPTRDGKPRQDEVSIIIKFTVSRSERFEVRTGEKVIPEYWNDKAQEVKRTHRDHVRINRRNSEAKSKLFAQYEQGLPFEQFKAIAQGKEEKKSVLSSLFDRFIKQYEQEKDQKTVWVYQALLHTLGPFLHLPFAKLNWIFFDAWKESIVHLTDSTANRYLTNLKCFLLWCADRNIKVDPSYKKWKIRPHYKEPLPLTSEELTRLRNKMMTGTAAIGRDILVIAALTGQRISDLRRFDIKDVKDKVWTFNRKKGHSLKVKRVSVDFHSGYCAPALEIFQKYGGKLPEAHSETYNTWIKEACRLADISTPITKETWKGQKCTVTTVPKWELVTTHTGRKTFINLAAEWFTPEEIMEMAGIESYVTLKKHYKGTGDILVRRKKLIQMEEELKAAKTVTNQWERRAK